MSRTFDDLRFALRTWRRHPVFAVVIVLTFALGIGADTAMFTVINAVLIRPLPYDHPDRLYYLRSPRDGTSLPDLEDFRSTNTVFSSMATFDRGRGVVSGGSDPEQVATLSASTDFFPTVGINPVRGRTFASEEMTTNAPVAMLSYNLWLHRFGGDTGVIGRTMVLNGREVQVVGVLPPSLDPALDADIFQPLDPHPRIQADRSYHTHPMLARLRAGVSAEAAAKQINSIAARLGTLYPEDAGRTVLLQRYSDFVVADTRPQLLYLLGAVTLVLLVACGNIASLMLASSTAREGELLTRIAVGASRARLVRQLLTESVALAFLGGALGFALAAIALQATQASMVDVLPRAVEIHLSGAGFRFAALGTLITGLVVGTAVALRATATAIQPGLGAVGRSSSSRRGTRVRQTIVTLQLTTSVLLLVGALELLGAFRRLSTTHPGFDPSRVLTARIALPSDRFDDAAAPSWWTEFLPQVAALPGVVSASASSRLPVASIGGTASVVVPGQATSVGTPLPQAQIDWVADGFFETLRIPIVKGSLFTPEQTSGREGVIVISAGMAERRFRFQDPIGKTLTFPDFNGFTPRVIGVAGDVRAFGLGFDSPDVVYFNTQQMHNAKSLTLEVRTRNADPLAILPAIRGLLAKRDPTIALGQVRTLAEVIGRSTERERLQTTVLGAFAAAALLLAALGLYGLLAYLVAARRQELSIRYALGARREQLFIMIVRSGMKFVAFGLVGGALLLPIVIGALRRAFDVPGAHAGTLGVVLVILLVGGAAACVIPARRATLEVRLAALPR